MTPDVDVAANTSGSEIVPETVDVHPDASVIEYEYGPAETLKVPSPV